MRWIWVRHGETEENRLRRYLGHYDAPLNERGRDQAKKVARQLGGEKIDYIYTSDLGRCQETAEYIARQHGIVPLVVPELRELHFGEWDRKTYEEIMQTHPEIAGEWYNNPYDIVTPGGESLRQLGERVDRWLLTLEQSMQPGETAVLVSHGGPIRWFCATWLKRDTAAFWTVEGPGTGEFFIVNKCGQIWTSPA
jgi:alpha-ribazole phosphatase